MASLLQLRTNLTQAIARARSLHAEIQQADAPTPEQHTALKTAVDEANAAGEAVQQAERYDAAIAALESRAAAPGERAGSPLGPHNDAANTRNGKHEYSLTRALRGELLMREGRGVATGLEAETHQHLASQRSKAPGGLLVPWDAPLSRGGLPAGLQTRDGLDTSSGAGAIAKIVRPTMIDMLRARMPLVALGATVIADMSNPFALPRTSAGTTGYWLTPEGSIPTGSNPTIDQVNFTYKSVGAKTKLTRQFILAASLDGENYIADQLTKTVATTVQGGAITGTGSSGQPKGLLSYVSGDGVNVKVMGANGLAMAYLDFLAMVGAVNTANAPDEARAFLINPTTEAYCNGTPKVAGFPSYIIDQSGKIGGYGYATTSLVPNNLTKGTSTGILSAVLFGAWSELAIALFSGVDLIVDPYSAAPHVNVTVAQDVDVQVLHPQSFSICLDLKTS